MENNKNQFIKEYLELCEKYGFVIVGEDSYCGLEVEKIDNWGADYYKKHIERLYDV